MRFFGIFVFLTSAIVALGQDQKQLADLLSAKAAKAEIKFDLQGNVTSLFFSNHQEWEKKNPGVPGLDDEDMKQLEHFPHLKSFKIETQSITSKGCEHLLKCSQIEELMFHYMDKKFAEKALDSLIRPDFMLVANHFKNQLKTLEIKHNFRLKQSMVDKLMPMPELKRLVLDNRSAGPSSVEFITHCPKIEELELHRTHISQNGMQKIIHSLPNLKILWIRPEKIADDKITYKILKDLGQLENLEELMLRMEIGPIPYEDGLEHLVKLEKLKFLKFNEGVNAMDEPLLSFRAKRPDVTIFIGYQKLN